MYINALRELYMIFNLARHTHPDSKISHLDRALGGQKTILPNSNSKHFHSVFHNQFLGVFFFFSCDKTRKQLLQVTTNTNINYQFHILCLHCVRATSQGRLSVRALTHGSVSWATSWENCKLTRELVIMQQQPRINWEPEFILWGCFACLHFFPLPRVSVLGDDKLHEMSVFNV